MKIDEKGFCVLEDNDPHSARCFSTSKYLLKRLQKATGKGEMDLLHDYVDDEFKRFEDIYEKVLNGSSCPKKNLPLEILNEHKSRIEEKRDGILEFLRNEVGENYVGISRTFLNLQNKHNVVCARHVDLIKIWRMIRRSGFNQYVIIHELVVDTFVPYFKTYKTIYLQDNSRLKYPRREELVVQELAHQMFHCLIEMDQGVFKWERWYYENHPEIKRLRHYDAVDDLLF